MSVLVPAPRPPPDGPPALGSRELQQLWFATLKRPWASLVVVPTHPDAGALQVGDGLVHVGSIHRGSAVRLIDAQGAELGRAVSLITEMTSHVLNGGTVVTVVDPVVRSQTGVPLAMAADAVLLCVTLGRTDLEDARRTLELIGHDRVLGCVALRPEAQP